MAKPVIKQTSLPGVYVIEPVVHGDERGFFLESWRFDAYSSQGIAATFVQDNHSKSERGVLRGLHFQNPHGQGKLVRAIFGEVFDVAVDIRRGSPDFGQWAGEILSANNFRQMFIPPGFAHGFCVLSDVAEFEYKCTDYYHPQYEHTVSWNDPDIGIKWPINNPVLSAKDQNAPRLHELHEQLPAYQVEAV